MAKDAFKQFKSFYPAYSNPLAIKQSAYLWCLDKPPLKVERRDCPV